MRFAQPLYLYALAVALPAAIGLFYWSWTVKQKLMRQFIRARLLPALTVGLYPGRQKFRLALLVAAIAGIFLALARPQWGFAWEEAHQKGLDIIIAIDTSRSMLARDVAPNRLERVKLAAYDLMKLARNDRLGLVPFAGTAFLQSPLTLDDQAFRMSLDALKVGIIPEGGTSLSSAIDVALQAFEKTSDNNKALVLFTDGEDHDEEADTLAAAKRAAEAGMHIYTIGVGTREGELLRAPDEQGNEAFVKDEDGNVVKSHLNENLLRQIATDAGGFYLPLQGPGAMDTLYSSCLAALPKSTSNARLTRVYQERYHWFLGFALLCLLAEFLLPESPNRARRNDRKTVATPPPYQKAAAAALILLLLGERLGASPSGAFNEYQSGDYKAAYEEYNRLAQKNTNDYRLQYDAGAAAYRAKDLEKAEKHFNATLASPSVTPDLQTQEHTYYDLGNTEYRLGEPLTEPDKKKERWQQAVNNYVQALKLNTNDLEARNNLMFVKRQLEELKKQQQQQNKQNKNNQDQNNDKNQQQQNQQQNQKDQQNKQNQQNQNQQDQKNQQQQSAQQKQKSDEQKSQEEQQKQEQARRDKEQQEQQQAQANQGKDKSGQEQQQEATPGKMTPQEARQMLAEQKDDEKALIFAPDNNKPAKTQPGKFKDW
jgi:Ca-activated chloride channel family protein